MNVRFYAGYKSDYLALPEHNQLALYFCYDTQELYWGDLCISDGIRVIPTHADLPELSKAADGVVYYIAETHNGYTLSPDRTEWLQTIYSPAPDAYEVPESEIYKTVTTVGAVRKIEDSLLARIAEIDAKIDSSAGKVDLSSYYTKAEVAELIASAIDALALPDFSKFITEIPAEYITAAELEAKGYLTKHQSLEDYAKKTELFNKDYNELKNKPVIPSIAGLAAETYVDAAVAGKADKNHEHPEYLTEHQSLADYATKKYVNDAVANIDIPTVDTSNLATTEALNAALLTKANDVLFTSTKVVTKPMGTFQIGDDLRDLTLAQIFVKLLGLSDSALTPDDGNSIVSSIINNQTTMHQINDNDVIVEMPFELISYTAQEATTNDGNSCFYVVHNDEGARIEAGYQHFTSKKEPYYIVALPESLDVSESGNVTLQTWDVENKIWVDAHYVLTSDYDEIVATYNADGITPPVCPTGYKLWADLSSGDPGTSYRYIIKE
jgi:hypothetical protein